MLAGMKEGPLAWDGILRSVVAIEALISESTLNAALSGGALRNDMPMKKYLANTPLGKPAIDLRSSEPKLMRKLLQ